MSDSITVHHGKGIKIEAWDYTITMSVYKRERDTDEQ